MVAARKIRCVMISVPAEGDRMSNHTEPRFRPSDLLPWADPHIRSMVEQLQKEVREEKLSRGSLAEQEAGLPERLSFDSALSA